MLDFERLPHDPENAFGALLVKADGTPVRTAIVHPVDQLSLSAALEGRDQGLIEPILIGPAYRIRTAANGAGLDIEGVDLLDTPRSHSAASEAARLVRSGEVDAVMKGALHTNELMSAMVDRDTGIRTDRRMSHAFLMDAPGYGKPLLITDGALNVAPDLLSKKWIIQNAIDLSHSLGIDRPRVAILSATEEVDPLIPSTLDAAALCKMAERGQISGGILDGPMAIDLAISHEAAAIKGFVSPVAGEADMLVVPNLEAGNMLAKQLDYLAGAAAAGLVLGAKVPIILTSRADSVVERIASCALAKLMLKWSEKRT